MLSAKERNVTLIYRKLGGDRDRSVMDATSPTTTSDHLRIMRNAKFVGILLTLLASCFAVAQERGTDPPATKPTPETVAKDPNLQVILAESKAFVEAFNKGDAAAVAGMWTSSGEYVDGAGNLFLGRDAIQKAYAEFFSENAGAKLKINVDSLKTLSDTAATEYGTSVVEVPSTAAVVSQYEAIHVKIDGKWQMASVRDAVIQTAVAEQNLLDLDFLIGSWIAEHHGNKTESVFSWVSDHRFVKREYTTTSFDGKKSSGMQLIGWNPQAGNISSWSFSPDGGHAIGAWMPTEDGWAAEMQGVDGNGVSTTAVNLLRRLDDNAYVWQSVERVAGGVMFDDTDEIVIKRQP